MRRRKVVCSVARVLVLALTAVESFTPLPKINHNRNHIFSMKHQQPTAVLRQSRNNDNDNGDDEHHPAWGDRRRFLMQTSWVATALASLGGSPPPALARGLVQFPCSEPLGNTYHFMRTGQSLLEEEDIWSTNPLFLTNREAALTELGAEQVVAAARVLKERNMVPTVVEYSLAASAIDTADLIGKECRIGHDRVLAEYTFLDPRAVGKYDMLPMEATQKAVWAMDVEEAGQYGEGGRPPPNEDSTPNETLGDQAVRLRQLFSVLETQYSGDTVLLVFPDGTGPALLSCLIAGIPLSRCHELEYAPGEVRLDVNVATTKALLKEKQKDSRSYKEALEEGRRELTRLRNMKPSEIVSVKDQKLQADRLEQENLAEQRAMAREQKEEQVRIAREERARQVEDERQRRRDAGESDFGGMLPVGLGAAGVGAAAILAMPKSEEEDTLVEVEPVLVGADGTAATTPVDPPSASPGSSLSNVMEAGGLAGSVEAAQERVDGDEQATLSRPKPKDRKEAADEAMKEYLERDDGGDAWLQMMADMAQDDDDDKDLAP